MSSLLVTVRFQDGRYHGRLDWPPAPARLFQALISGAAQGDVLAPEDQHAFRWLETLAAPVIAAPPMRPGQGHINYVPNNDLDAVGGDPRRIAEIRAAKYIRPTLFDAEMPLLYAWTFGDTPEARGEAQRICIIAERLYQLGRGIDMAWARGEILPMMEAEARLGAHRGALHRPSGGSGGRTLSIPLTGSFDSLLDRHKKTRSRFRALSDPKAGNRPSDRTIVFTQPPKPRFGQVAYDSPPKRVLFDLIGPETPWQLDRVVGLTKRLRDAAAETLKAALPEEAAKEESDTIRNAIVGRRDADEADKAARVRITPLPSIGHPYADHAIRRVLVEIPANCPLRADDVEWAFSSLLELATATDHSMLGHYGVADDRTGRVWRTVTAAALPQQAARRRIDPARRLAEAKAGTERAEEEARAACAVANALRQADVPARPLTVRVQRDPFEAKGARAEAFSPETRFAKERLWHVEVEFDAPRRGPLVLGDGRYLGLGLMAPVRHTEGVLAFAIESGSGADMEPLATARALRRTVFARVQAELGPGRPLPLYVTGHEENGAPARRGTHQHIACVHDGDRRRLLLLAPHVLERRSPARDEAEPWRLLERAMLRFEELHAGAHTLRLTRTSVDLDTDVIFAPAQDWESMTTYRVVRHRKQASAAAALAADMAEECRDLRLPRAEMRARELCGLPGKGLSGHASLRFAVAVPGPILIGRDRHFGGGLFVGRPPRP